MLFQNRRGEYFVVVVVVVVVVRVVAVVVVAVISVTVFRNIFTRTSRYLVISVIMCVTLIHMRGLIIQK